MRKFKSLALLAAAAMVATSVVPVMAEETTEAADTASDEEWFSSDIDTSEHVTIVYVTTGNKPTNTATDDMLAQLNEILTEKVNAELEIYYIEWTDYLTNYNLLLSSLDGTIDLVGTATDWLDAWPNAKKGAFLELSEDMLQTYCPKTYAQVEADGHWEDCMYNGQIYLIPEDNYSQWINHGFMYRQDWADEAGLTDGVHSWEDMTTYFQGILDNHPDVIPWDSDGTPATTVAGGWIASHTDDILIDGLGTCMFYGTKEDPYTIISPYMDDDTLYDYADLMYEWNEMGVWRTDVLNNTETSTRDELYAGTTGTDQHHTETWYGAVRPEMDEQQPGSDVGFFWFGEEMGNLVRMTTTHGAMAISAASQNPERALMVYDLLRNDEECYRLFNYGIEGVQYEFVDPEDESSLLIQRPESYDEETDGIVTDYWWGRNDDLELRWNDCYWDGLDEISQVYESVAIDYPYGQFVIDTSPISSYISSMSEVWDTYMKQIAFGQSDDPHGLVDEFREQMKNAGYDEVLSYLQEQMDAVYGDAAAEETTAAE